jgi:hypothetical protein
MDGLAVGTAIVGILVGLTVALPTVWPLFVPVLACAVLTGGGLNEFKIIWAMTPHTIPNFCRCVTFRSQIQKIVIKPRKNPIKKPLNHNSKSLIASTQRVSQGEAYQT